jgi:cobalt/nickel transport system permease protein
MHMADALISPSVGGAMWAVSAGLAVYSAKRLKEEANERKTPLMGVLGAFVFTAQMINFTIPATGSSGHLGGGMILSILLGPYAAFLTMFSILTVQALFFADGGLLALGCNVFNMGFWTCFVAYPLIFRKIVDSQPTQGRLATGATLAGVIGLQLGAFSVVAETLASGISQLPFGTFVLLMQPIHLGIGLVEGLVTTALVTFVWKARPEILDMAASAKPVQGLTLRPVLTGLAIATIVTGGALSWFASTHPDGLEWSMFKTTGKEELAPPEDGVHSSLSALQEKTAFLPDYDFRKPDEAKASNVESGKESVASPEEEPAERWPSVNAGTSLSGLLGGAFVLVLAGLIGLALRRVQTAA